MNENKVELISLGTKIIDGSDIFLNHRNLLNFVVIENDIIEQI